MNDQFTENIDDSPRERLAFRLGGAAGDGLQSTGNLLQKYFSYLGYYVQGFPGTQSTIRGGHVWQHVEISSSQILSHTRQLDILLAFNEVALEVHLRDVRHKGYLVYDPTKTNLEKYQSLIQDNAIRVISIPLFTMSNEIKPRMFVLMNSIAIGVLFALLDLNYADYEKVLAKRFVDKETITKLNMQAIDYGSSYYKENYSYKVVLSFPNQVDKNKIVISGNEAIALGAVAGGMRFLAQYPITPASSILTYLAKHADDFGICVKQTEDELSAINMAIGASFAGARAMTASSGPGLSLKAEAFGYAAMTETPLVIINAMRGGPSTGIPTKMEQADLNSMIYLSHGDVPRIVLAPRNIREAFYMTAEAFNLTEKYQIPVIILSDFALSERTENLEEFDMQQNIDRGYIWNGPTEEDPVFKRYKLTQDGISPRAFPPTEDGMYILVGAEHDEFSHSLSGNRCGIPSSWDIREKMNQKRFRKFELVRESFDGPELYGPKDADHTIICWGSTQGAIMEAVDIMNKGNETWNMLSFAYIHPLPYDKIKPLLHNIDHSIIFEVNYTGQFERLIHEFTGWRPDDHIRPLDGETPTSDMIVGKLLELLESEKNE